MVKISRLTVTKLYRVFDYDVKFNSDVTFIYGENGCGKTTILNITEAIITGQLYNLFNYKFNEINLFYLDNGKKSIEKAITIIQEKSYLIVTFNKQTYTIQRDNLNGENIINNFNIYYNKKVVSDFENINKIYFDEYPVLNQIKRTFNYVYLPLNRSSIYDELDYYDIARSFRNNLSDYTKTDRVKVEIGIRQVEKLITSKYININSTIAIINDEFRNKILKSLIETISEDDIFEGFVGMLRRDTSIAELHKIKNKYIKILSELELLTKSEEKSINDFFNRFLEELSEHNLNNTKSFDLPLILKYHEIIKIKKIVDIAKKSEEKKTTVRRPIETFLSTINEFIGTGTEKKQILIDNEGKIFFTTRYSNDSISIHHLSSGEKQLLIFFANLIFNVKSGQSGIFVVDEPELSLHLSWQRKFVEKALDVNSNLQLIFATHAPEIIGNRRDKTFRLEKIFQTGR